MAKLLTRRQRPKSTRRALASILLAFEAFIVFFATLVAFGTKLLGPGTENAAIVWAVGLGFVVLALVLPAILTTPMGYSCGWLLQIALVVMGVWVPLMYFLGGICLCLWIWAMVAGGTIDKARQAYERSQGAQP